MFRTMRLRGKKKNCAICGDSPTITELIDYEQFCSGAADDKTVDETILNRNERIDVHVKMIRIKLIGPITDLSL